MNGIILLIIGIILIGIIIVVIILITKANGWDGINYKPYLLNVYPAMDTTKTPREYQNLYHSLGWYYQCCSSNNTSIHSPQDTNTKQISYNFKVNTESWTEITGDKIIGPNGETPHKMRYPARGGIYNGNKWTFLSVNWNEMRCCKSTEYKLPTIPRGHLYDWYSFQYFNVPIITTTKNGYNFAGQSAINGNSRDISTFCSQSPSTSFQGYMSLNTSLDTAVISASDPTGVKKEIPLGIWAGPGPFYAGERAILRAIYYPFGPQYQPSQKRWILNGEKDYTKWLTTYLTRKELESKLFKDQITDKYWFNGFDEGDHVDFGHVQQMPGLAMSTGYWHNYFGGGTGIFHRIGKTPKVSQEEVDAMKESLPKGESKNLIDIVGISPRNKTHMLFNLLWKVRATKKLPQHSGGPDKTVGTNYTNGSKLLYAFYGTDDPWIITMWYANGYADVNVNTGVPSGINWTNYDINNNPLGTPMPNFNGFSYPLGWAVPAWLNGMGPSMKLISRQLSTSFMFSIPKLGVYNLPDFASDNNGTSLYNLYGVMEDGTSGVTFATLAAFLLQAEFGPVDELSTYVTPPNKTDKVYNTLPSMMEQQFPSDNKTGGIGTITYKGLQYTLTKIFMTNYFYDRVSNGVSFDEPMNYFANVLGYEDLQMPINTNTNGVWSFESIYTGLPREEDKLNCDKWAYTWRDTLIRSRQYEYITDGIFQGPAMAILNQLWGTTLSVRDPFDIKSDKKSLPCYGVGGFPCNGTPQTTCTKKSLFDINKATKKKTKYEDPIYKGQCTVEDNIGMNKKTTATVLWDKNNYCHAPWSQNKYNDKDTLWPPGDCCMGSSFCQVPGDKPTFSSIWSNVTYGGYGYGNGIVPLSTSDHSQNIKSVSLSKKLLTQDNPLPPQSPIGDPRKQFVQHTISQLE